MIAEPEGGGVDVQKCMAWGHGVLRGAVNISRVIPGPGETPPVALSLDLGFFGRGSANMNLLYSVLLYVYALLSPMQASLSVHRRRLLNFLAHPVHGQEETGTLSATHAQLWCGGLFFALWAASKVGDKQVADALIRYLSVDFALWQALSVGGPVPDVWSPGARAKDTAKKGHGELLGSNSARTACWRLIALLDPVAGSWQRKLVHFGDNQYNLGPLALRETPKEIVAQIKAERPDLSKVRMCRPFHVRRWPSSPLDQIRLGAGLGSTQNYIAWFEPGLPVAQGARGDAPAHAAGVIHGTRWIEGPLDQEGTVFERHMERYPTTRPSLTIDMEGAP